MKTWWEGKAPLNFSVFSAAGESLLLATCPAFPFSVDELRRSRSCWTGMDIRFSFVGGFRQAEESMMRAARIYKFGPPNVIVIEELRRPGYEKSPAPGAAVHRDLAEIGDK